jgi:hypothetical protein
MSLLPISKPVAEDAPASFVGSPISPALRAAYLDWRRVWTVSSLFWKITGDLPCGDEEDATSSLGSAADQLEGVLRDRVTGFTALTDADRMLKMRCLLESDEDALQGFDHGLLPDLIALGRLAVVVEPAAVEHPRTDAEWRDTLTAKPDTIVDQKPADLLRLFTLGEGGELFAMSAAYRAAKSGAPDRMGAVLASLDAYGSFACAFGYDDKGDYQFLPGAILSEEERAALADLGHLPDSAVERLCSAVEAHRAAVSERYRQQEEERKAKKAAEDRAKHGPPLRERLVPLLPSFSDEARDSAVRIIYGASMIALARVMLPEKAESLSEAELESLRQLDFSTLTERFEPGCEQALHEEMDRLLGLRRSAPAA